MMPASSDVETPSRTVGPHYCCCSLLMKFPFTQTLSVVIEQPPRRKKGRRNFGTLLSANSPPPSSLKKKVKVKRSSSSRTPSTNIRTSPAAATTTAATTITSGESNDDLYTVTFEPGPIGLQIEPAGSGAVRVQRFVDGGPRAPGPARRTGLIQLGDLVTRVNKRPIVSYETTVQLLQQTGVRREMTLQRVSWNHHKQKKDPPRRLPGTLRKKQTPKGADKQSDSSDDSELRPISFVVDTLVTPHPQQDEENQGKADSSLSPDASLETASLHSVTPSITTMDRGPALSPSRIKEIVRNESSTKEAATFSPHKREKTRSSPSKSVLKTVYTSVVPTAGAVASGSLKVGSLLSTKLGEALVGHSSSEFDTTVQLKHELLNELSQAKATLHTQQETIQTLLRSQAQEKERLEQELDLSRREKLIAEQSLVQLQEQLHDTSPAQQAEYRDRIEELQRLLRDTEISRDKLDSHVQMLQDKLSRLNEEAANSNSPGELECLQEKNDELSDRLDMLVMQLAQKESKLTESRATIRELEAAHASMQREIEAAQASMQSELEAAQASMQREINQSSSETQDTLRRRDAKIQELTQEMTVLQHELSQKGTSTTATSVTLEQVATEKRHLASENARLNTRMDQVVQERARFKEQLELSERQLSDLKDAQATKLSNLQTTSSAQVERLQRELSLKEQNLSESNITIQRLRDDLARADREKEGLRDAAMGESKLRTELERTRTELKKVVESSRQAEREWKQTVEHWERENQTRRGSMVTQQSELREQSNQLEAITVKYEDVLGALKVAKLDLQQAQVQAATFKQEKEEAVKREKCIRAEAEERIQSIIQDASHKVEAEARGEISELKRHVKSLESSITLARRENESLHKLNTDLSSRVSKLHDSLDEKENNISAKRIEALEQNGQIEDLRDDLARKHEELDSCKSSLETAKDQYAMLNERLSHVSEEFSKDKRKMTTELIELRDHCAELESQNSDLERLLRSLRRTASESEARWTSTRQELLHEREALRELRVSSEQTRTKLEERMVVLKTDVSNYKELSAVSTDHVNELKSKNKSMSVEIDSLKQDCSDLKTLLQRRTSANLSDREALEAKLGTEREKVSKLSKKLALSDSEVHALKKGLGQQKQQFEQLIAKQAVESELRSKKQSEWLATKEAELKQLSVSVDQLRDAQSEAARLRDSLRRSRNEVEHLTDLLDTIREEHASREIELVETHKEESRRLETEKDELEASLRKSEEQRDALESCLFAAEEGLSAARTERENLITERKDLSTALHKAEDNLMELQGEFDNFRREHMDASTDSSKGELSDLSRGELKTRCSELLSHLEASERRATAAAEDASRRSTHVKRLAEDLDAMSGEIDKLLHSNELLDRFLQETRSDKVTAESEAASAKTKAELLAEEVDRIRRDLEEQRNKNATLTDSNQEIQFRLERENQEQKELQRKLEADSQRLLTLLSETQADKDATDGTVSRLRMELSGMIAEKEQSSRRLVELETLLEEQKTQLIEFEAQKDATREQYDADISRYETKSASLEDECASLRRRVSELEVAVETQTIDLRNKEETEKTKTAALEKYRQDRHETETKHQDAVSKLVEASRVVASQKDSIRALEHKAAEADKLVASMSEQIKNLQSTILKLESSSETNVGFRSKQLIDLKEKCAAIDEDRLALRQEVSVLRGELRQARKESMEYQSVNKTLLSRIDSLKTAVDATQNRAS